METYPDVPQELYLGVREGAQSRSRFRRGHCQGKIIPLLQFFRLLPRHRHLVQQRQDVGSLRLRVGKNICSRNLWCMTHFLVESTMSMMSLENLVHIRVLRVLSLPRGVAFTLYTCTIHVSLPNHY